MIDTNILLAWGATYKTYEAKEHIFAEGQKCYYYFQLSEGKVSWLNINDDGKEFIHKLILPNESFGELPLFDNDSYSADAVALEKSVILRLPRQLFIQLIKENPEIMFKFNKILTEHLRFKFLLLKTIAFENPEKRVLTLLNYLKSKFGEKDSTFQVDLTRQQIANMTGLRVETVIRVIRKMNETGDLIIDHGKIKMNK
ncbi:MAG: Crp/Fnr family transcriptional regulator [Bacteroidetes bacterium]|nr:Crp/Fnr family transcriptional regulator [Bacteroidota bacterium]